MLDLDRPVSLFGLALFADSHDPDLFHVLPGPPRLVGGAEGFSLLIYRGEAAGGLAMMEICAPPAPQAVEHARRALARRQGGPVRLVPVTFDGGTARLWVPGRAHAEAARSPEDMAAAEALPAEAGGGAAAPAASEAPASPSTRLGEVTPSLFGDLRASFAVRLSPAGARLVQAALSSPGPSALACAYSLRYRGLMRGRSLRIEVDYHRAYEWLGASAQAGSLWLRADARVALERLVQRGDVRVEDVSAAPASAEDLARREQEVATLLEELLVPLYWEPDVAAPAAGEPGAAQAALRMAAHRQTEQRVLTFDRRHTGVVERWASTSGLLTWPEEVALETRTRWVDLGQGWPEPRTLIAEAPPGERWKGVERVVVQVQVADWSGGLVLSAAHPRRELSLPPGAAQVKVHALAAERPDALGAPTPRAEDEVPWRPLEGAYLALDPGHEAGLRQLEISLPPASAHAVAAAVVRATLGDPTLPEAPSRTLRLDAEHPSELLEWWTDAPVRLDVTLVMGPDAGGGELHLPGRLIAAQERLVLIRTPVGTLRTITAALVDPLARIASASVELDAGPERPRGHLRLTADRPQASWSTHPSAHAPLRYRTTTVYRSGASQSRDWQPLSGGLVSVGDAELRVRWLAVHLLAPADHHGAWLKAYAVDPAPDAPGSDEVLLEPGLLDATLRLAVATPDAPVRVLAEVYLASGEVLALGPSITHGDLIVLGPASV